MVLDFQMAQIQTFASRKAAPTSHLSCSINAFSSADKHVSSVGFACGFTTLMASHVTTFSSDAIKKAQQILGFFYWQ
ncbi:MAG: hypothetical protein ABI475_03845 [Methylophilaceae bacterium]